MKKCILIFFFGISSIIHSSEIPPLTIETNDGQIKELARDDAKVFNALKEAVDLDLTDTIKLPPVSSSAWKDAVEPLFLNLKAENNKSAFDNFLERLKNFTIKKLLIHLYALEYLDPTIYDDSSKEIKLLDYITGIPLSNFNLTLRLLTENNYEISKNFTDTIIDLFLRDKQQPDIYQKKQVILPIIPINTLKISHSQILNGDWSPHGNFFVYYTQDMLNILKRDGTIVNDHMPDYTVKTRKIAWSADETLALIAPQNRWANRVLIWKRFQGWTVLASPKCDLNMSRDILWSPQGQLAILLPNGIAIRKPTEEIIFLDTKNLGEIKAIKWSSEEDLAVVGENGLIIRTADENEIYVDTTDIGINDILFSNENITWSQKGELAIRGGSRLIIQNKNDRSFDLEKKAYSMSWSPTGQLAFTTVDAAFIWQEGKELIRLPLGEQNIPPTTFWLPDGKLAVFHNDNELLIWESTRKPTLVKINVCPRFFGETVTSSSDGKLAGACGETLFFGEPERLSSTELKPAGNIIQNMWSPKGRLAVQNDKGFVFIKDLQDNITTTIRCWDLGKIIKLEWSSEEKLAIIGRDGFKIYNAVIPEEYKHLSLAQALLIIKFTRTKNPHYLNHREYNLYKKLPEILQNQYPSRKTTDLPDLSHDQINLINHLSSLYISYLNKEDYDLYKQLPAIIQEQYPAEEITDLDDFSLQDEINLINQIDISYPDYLNLSAGMRRIVQNKIRTGRVKFSNDQINLINQLSSNAISYLNKEDYDLYKQLPEIIQEQYPAKEITDQAEHSLEKEDYNLDKSLPEIIQERSREEKTIRPAELSLEKEDYDLDKQLAKSIQEQYPAKEIRDPVEPSLQEQYYDLQKPLPEIIQERSLEEQTIDRAELSEDQMNLIGQLSPTSISYLNEKDYDLYKQLPEIIQEQYPAIPIMLD